MIGDAVSTPHLLVAALAILLAVWTVLLARLDRATLEVRAAEVGMRDASTNLLTRTGFELAVANELAWAAREGVSMALVAFEVSGLEWRPSMARAATRIRGHEHAGLLGGRRFGVLLWDADASGVHVAAARLGAPLFGDELLRVSVGWALVEPAASVPTLADLESTATGSFRPLAPLVDALVTLPAERRAA